MKYFKTALFSLALAVVVCAPTAAHAATNASTAALLAQIQSLKAQLQLLEQQLLLRGTVTTPTSDCYTDIYGQRFCIASTQNFNSASDIDTIEVDFVGDIAQVRVEFDDRDTKFYAVEARTREDVARLLSRELNVSPATILGLIDEVNNFSNNRNNSDDIRSIDVTFDGDDADVVVRFEDADTDRFTLRNVDGDRNDVVQELADRYDESESRIRNLTDFNNSSNNNNDDVESIDVDFDGDDADIFVRFEDGDTQQFTLRNVDEDEDEVIRLLADRYDMDENDIEDVTEFEGRNSSDIDSINVDFVGDDANIFVRFENGRIESFTLRNVDDDEDDVIEELADRYNMSEREIEDVIDFE